MPYPEYKDSGVAWLGPIPTDWTTCALGRFVRFRNGADYSAVEVESGGYPVIGSGGEFRRASSYLFEGESVLFGRKGTVDRPLHINGRFWTVDTMYFTEIALDKLVPRFVYYWATQLPYSYWLTSTALPSMTQSDLAAAKIPYISMRAQAEIAAFLDRETAEIDAFIADQEELIGLLAERRSATISHAVTKGLDPSVPMKDSGVAWLGQVPVRWSILSPRRLFQQRRDLARDEDEQLAATQEFGVIPQAMYTERTGYRVTAVLKGFEILKHVEPGDFVISMRSFQGGLEYSSHSGKISSAYVMLSACGPVVDDYFRYLFKSTGFISALRSTSNLVRDGQAMRFSNFAQVQVAVPDVKEQARIAGYLDHETAELDAAIADAREAIALSKERRAALISAAVTGKIDVRGMV